MRKGDIYEFAFDVEKRISDGMVRDYIIRAVGRYQPDYEVYTNLVPGRFQLYDNYPNPFNTTTLISYDLPAAVHVTIDVYNTLGQRVARLVERRQSAGHHVVQWEGNDDRGNPVSSGIYHCHMRAEEFVSSRKMVLMK